MLSDTSFYVNKIVTDKSVLKKYDYLKNSLYVIYQFIFNKYEKDETNGALILDSYADNTVTNIKYYKVENVDSENESDEDEDESEEDEDEAEDEAEEVEEVEDEAEEVGDETEDEADL
jgi:hypothetical protein